MSSPHPSHPRRRSFFALCLLATLWLVSPAPAHAHPLGNFTVNHFARLEVSPARIRVHYVVDMAEIPTYQEVQTLDVDGDGQPAQAELEAYAARTAHEYANELTLTIDNAAVPLKLDTQRISLLPGAGGLPTLRLECDYEGALAAGANPAQHVRFADTNHQGRIGWHEVVVTAAAGAQVYDSTAYGTGLSNELRDYPNDRLAAPLDERTAAWTFTTGALPAHARPLLARDGRKVEPPARDRLAELISVKELTLGGALLGLLLAAVLGGFHAMSPGHGKTVVAAYLIGSRGTAKHAAFLGLTVTLTHTAGVFALGLITLFAAQYIVPERLYPILSFVSGAIVVVIGLSLFARRLGAALGFVEHEHGHDHAQAEHAQLDHTHDDATALTHTHGGAEHSHLPPGTDGRRVTWRSLLALGISGGLLPCPSALVVLLSAISLHRVGYGMLLVVAFSFGLATALTSIGLLFVYARRWIDRPLQAAAGLVRVLPALSAFVISCAGLFICYEAVGQAGYSVPTLLTNSVAQVKSVFTTSP